MSDNLTIRNATKAEFETAVEWAANEGWNPGLEDLEHFYETDPNGFYMGWVGEKPISSISVVRYNDNYGFLGFYIVDPKYRGTGAGIATWNAGLEYLSDCSIALDGVVEQQENYKKSGFNFVGKNIRFVGAPTFLKNANSNVVVRAIKADDWSQILKLDQTCFGTERSNFLSTWCLENTSQNFHSLVSIEDGQITGFGTIRRCKSGYKIGPLFCMSEQSVSNLFNGLIANADLGEPISIDVPLANEKAAKLLKSTGMEECFETARMVRGEHPNINWNFVYGITSLELG